MTTVFGDLIRKWRAERGVLLKQMADQTGWTSAYISAVETGRKPVTETFVKRVANFFDANEDQEKELFQAAEDSPVQAKISLTGVNAEDRRIAAAFARKFTDLSENQKTRIKELLEIER